MKKILISFSLLCSVIIAAAQDAAQLQETANGFMRAGDFPNAVLVLNRAYQLQPDNVQIGKDLALNYYFEKDYTKALNIIKPVLDKKDADDQCYQVAGDIYRAMDNTKEAEKIYKSGIKKFPSNGALYNELGEMKWGQNDYDAIKQWEEGIKVDPSFSKNYYNASKYYYFTMDKIWSLIYGEIFLNMEPMSLQGPEIKKILLEGYKKLFADADIAANIKEKEKNSFATAFLETMNKQSSLASSGINVESLTMIRTRFILDWYNDAGKRFPMRLFEHQRQMLQEGMFEAYNQWIFGAADNLPAYQNWTNNHTEEYNELMRFQKGRIFKIPMKQYYH
jgi:tetratricopeptide (TPR) repeat protein